MRCGWIFVVALGGCGRVGFDGGVSQHAYRKRVTVTPNVALTDVPLSIVTTDSDLQRHAAADGLDVVFTDEDSLPLDHELVHYDGGTGTLEAWVRVPAVAPSTQLWMYYGGPSQTSAVASTWAGYAGVWHMSGTGNSEADSTVHANVARAITPAAQPMPAPGIVGGARDYDGVANSMTVIDPLDGSLDPQMSSFTYGIWVFVAASVGEWDMPLYKGGSSAALPGYDIELGRNFWEPCFGDGANQDCMPDFGSETQFLGGWISLVVVLDREVMQSRTYVNGVPVGNAGTLASIGSIDGNNLNIGHTNSPFKGRLDELRVYTGVLSDARIAAEYANIAARDSFVTFGAEETLRE